MPPKGRPKKTIWPNLTHHHQRRRGSKASFCAIGLSKHLPTRSERARDRERFALGPKLCEGPGPVDPRCWRLQPGPLPKRRKAGGRVYHDKKGGAEKEEKMPSLGTHCVCRGGGDCHRRPLVHSSPRDEDSAKWLHFFALTRPKPLTYPVCWSGPAKVHI